MTDFKESGDAGSGSGMRNVLGSGGRGQENRAFKEDIVENFLESIVDVSVIFCIYAVVILGRGITDRSILKILRKPEVYIWMVTLVCIICFVKQYFPRVEDNVLGGCFYTVVRLCMAPLHPGGAI
jgi:hypothetical protein